MITERIARLAPQLEPTGSDHAEFVICDHTIEITYNGFVEYQWVRTLGEKLMDAANLGFGGLILGQVIAQQFRLDWTLWGIGIWIGGYALGTYLVWLQERLASSKEV